MTRTPYEVLIIGGGIGGLCLAQGLRKNGVQVQVYERDASPDARLQGYRLNIEPKGSHALHTCLPQELWELLVATSGDPGPTMGVFDEKLRRLMQEDDPGPRAPEAAHHAVSRRTLRTVLLSGLEGIVHFGKTFERYSLTDAGRVVAHFRDGSAAEGDLLVGADGIHSKVRRQLLPERGEVVVPAAGIGGKLPLTEQTRAWLPEALQRNKNMILPPRDFLFTAAFRRRKSAQELSEVFSEKLAARGLHPEEIFARSEDCDYILWAYVAHRKTFQEIPDDPIALQQALNDRVANWNPFLQRLIAETDAGTIQAFEFSAAKKPDPWPTSNVTLLGDALHAMPPVGGMGGNAALRDAELLSAAVVSIRDGQPHVATLRACEASMLAQGFEAVSASLLYTQLAISRIPLMRSTAKIFFRTCGLIGPLRRAVFSEPPMQA